MGCHDTTVTEVPENAQHVLLLGTANSGKSSLFNLLTGNQQTVGNWPGVTVDKKSGLARHNGQVFNIVDLPGVASLASDHTERLDETITRQVLLESPASTLVVTIDPLSPERALSILLQGLHYGLPTIGVLTKADMWPEEEAVAGANRLADNLGIPVLAVSANTGAGREALLATLADAARNKVCLKDPAVTLPSVDVQVTELEKFITSNEQIKPRRARALSYRLLEGDKLASTMVSAKTRHKAQELIISYEEQTENALNFDIADAYYTRAFELGRVLDLPDPASVRYVSDKLDSIALSSWFGVPVFMAVMYAMFFIAISFSGPFIDFFDGIGDAFFVQTPALALETLGLGGGMLETIVLAIGGGVQTVLTFIPVVGLLFLCQVFLEQSGYMARAAVVMDRLMRKLGLPGKAFLPMILGFGCTVPAVIATRSLENRRERIMSAMMTPFMSCGARLPVYALFAAAFFADNGQNIVFLLYLMGIAVAIFTGLVLSTTVFPGERSALAIELPTYQLPDWTSLFRIVWARLYMFIMSAGRVIVMMVAVLAVLNSVSFDGSTGNESNGTSVLAVTSKAVTPVLSPLGITEDNWQATVGLVTGIFAKEALVGTLQELYVEPAAEEEAGGPAPLEALAGAFDALSGGLMDLSAAALDPLGISVGDISSEQVAADELEVDAAVFASLRAHFDGQVGAFAFMVAVLLYMPCAAAVAAIWREIGREWTLFAVAWTSLLAYSGSTITYQIGTFARHPGSSLVWILGLVSLIAMVIIASKYFVRTGADEVRLATTTG
ncbi:ferrous iron transport protein B [Pseudovibrio sp. SPO723]|uniref:ferrous iron transport protein B n=1 Tax=Nesiotobacter zosterae TaxID=392721 RepID=UPI0029C1C54F|nr:ferrous iron transport protein B [Pseudovibrio sp. SPO723]MDX5592912.1 ferrous iron transport protein B [Pseudovibrio sp. SPO723]